MTAQSSDYGLSPEPQAVRRRLVGSDSVWVPLSRSRLFSRAISLSHRMRSVFLQIVAGVPEPAFLPIFQPPVRLLIVLDDNRTHFEKIADACSGSIRQQGIDARRMSS